MVLTSCAFLLLNISLGVLGLVLLAAGVCLQMTNTMLKPYVDPLLEQLPIAPGATADIASYLQPAAIAFIVMGAVFLILAILACVGLCCKGNGASVLFFLIYALVMGCFLLIFIALTALIGAPEQFIGSRLQSYMNLTLVNQYVAVDSSDAVNIVWNVAQLGLQCCGTTGGMDYKYALKFNRAWITMPDPSTLGQTMLTLIIPPSCCKTELLSNVIGGQKSEAMGNSLAMKGCVYEASPRWSNYASGCYSALFKEYYKFQWFILGPAIAICLILLFLVVVPVVFACNNKAKQTG